MPSVVRSLALSTALFGSSAWATIKPSDACPVTNNSPLSCQNATAVQNTCCFNAPGGQLLQTQFWDAGDGPSNSFTVHGLWPDNCDGTYQQFCDSSRQYTNITEIIRAADPQLLEYMNQYWLNDNGTSESFWEHEWGKHGTCISTFDPNCYQDYQPGDEVPGFFNKTVSLFQTLNSYEFLQKAGITPSSSKTYASSDIIAALKAGHGATPSIQCEDGALSEVWYFFNVRGSAQTGQYVATEPDGSKSDCPAQVKYPPKQGGASPSTTTTPHQTPTAAAHRRHQDAFGPKNPRWA